MHTKHHPKDCAIRLLLSGQRQEGTLKTTFTAVVERISRWANGREKKDSKGKAQTEKIKRETGCVDPKVIKKYKLTTNTRPEEYADIVLPFKKNMQGGKEQLSFRQLKDWTNIKASLADAGKDGTCY